MINKASFNFDDLVAIFGLDSLIDIDQHIEIVGISTDSRTTEQGNAFVALIGENFDGHSKISDAFEAGARLIVVNEDWYSINCGNYLDMPFAIVKNSLTALGKIANYHRQRFSYPVLAVAGSNGKTTTKDFIAHVLSVKFNVLKTHLNFNNQVGVPLMLLQMDESYNMVVLEIGTNEPGEINILSKIAAPTHGLITNIGKEHLEKLFDIDGVEMEETTLYAYLRRQHAFGFINADDPRLLRYAELIDKKIIYGQADFCNLRCKIDFNDQLQPILNFDFEDNNFVANLKTIGLGTAYSGIAATAVALSFEIQIDQIKAQLESFEVPEGHGYNRMKLQDIGKYRVLNDCYNANPSSMILALETLNNFNISGKKIAVLGDMRELGDASEYEHIEMVEKAVTQCDKLLLIGEEFLVAANEFSQRILKVQIEDPWKDTIFTFEKKSELIEFLISIAKPEDLILIKGSRGMKMEEVIVGLEG